MKTKTKKILLVALSLALVFSCLAIIASANDSNTKSGETGNKINIWLVAGQSNAVGYGTVVDYPDGYSDADILDSGISNVLFYGKGYGNDSTSFAPVTFGLGKSATHSGPEIGIATALKSSGEKHVIIKYASGDTQLSAMKVTADNNISTWTPPSYVADHPEITFEGDKIGDLYDGFIATVEEAITKLEAEGYSPVVNGFWWMQGERDSNHGSMTADLYSTLLETLISDVRRDVGAIVGEDLSAMPTVIGRVYCNPAHTPLSQTGLEAVQTAQEMVANNETLVNVSMLDTRYDLVDPDSGEAKGPVQQDKWHYDALTQQMIGEAFVNKAYSLQDGIDGVYIQGYGYLPLDKADATKYPIVLFQNGEFKGAYAKADFKAAYAAAHALTKENRGASAAKILLRGDAEFAGTAHADKLGSSFSEIDINLGGYTLTHTGASFIFYLRMFSHTTEGETFTLNIRNGNIASANYVLFGVGASYEGTDKSVKLTNLDINMTDVTVTVTTNKGWNSGPIFYNQGTTNNSSDKEMEIDLTMTDCTLDLSGMKKASTIFDTTSNHVVTSNNVVTQIHSFDITINGGEIILGKGTENVRPYASKLYTLNDYSSITFGKGTDGKYIELTVPSDVTANVLTNTATPFYTDEPIIGKSSSGAKAEFVKFATSGDWVTYAMQKDEYIEGYGTIPTLYSNFDKYPVVLFQNGQFKGAYGKTEFATALGAAKDCVSTVGASAAKILLRRDAEFAGTGSVDNLGFALGEIDINLGGYSLTHTSGTFVFYLRMKGHTVNGETFTFNIRNGNLIVEGNGVLFAVGAQSEDESVELTNVNINMENVNLVHNNNGYNSGPIFYAQAGDNKSKDKEIKYTLTMTDCIFDFSKMGKGNAIFDTVTGHTASSDGVMTHIHAFDITVNGGELIVGKGNNSGRNPNNSSLYTLNDYSSITFGKGSDGEYLKLTVPADVTSSIVNSKVNLDNGIECVFVKSHAERGTVTYKAYPEVMVGYKIKSSVTLYSNFVYNVYIPEQRFNKAMINGVDATATLTEIDGVNYYHVVVNISAPESLNDIKLTVVLNTGDTTVEANWNLSVLKYAKSVINGNYDDTTKTLMKDMLVYASAAHTYFENTEAVAAKLAEIKTLLGDYNATLPTGEAKQPADKTYFTDVAVYLGAVPSFRFYLADGYTAADFSFKVGKRAVEVTEGTDKIGKYVEVTMYAYMMLDDVTYTVKGTDVTGTYNLYSYYEYAKTLNNANLVAIVEGLMKYSVSAKAYRDSVVKN